MKRRLPPCAIALAVVACGTPSTPPRLPDPVRTDLRAALTADANAPTHVRITVRRRPRLEEHRELERAGIDLLAWVPPDAYYATLRGAAGLTWIDGAGRELIRDVRPLDPARKLHSALVDELRAGARAAALVVFFRDVRSARIDEVLGDLGLASVPLAGDMRTVTLPSLAVAEALAQVDEVLMVSPSIRSEPANDDATAATKSVDAQQMSNGILSPLGTYHGVTGLDVRIAVTDKRIFEAHPDFGGAKFFRSYKDLPSADPSLWGELSPADPSFPHSTAMASAAAGSGAGTADYAPPDGQPKGHLGLRGHAPRALLGNYPYVGVNAFRHAFVIAQDQADVLCHGQVTSSTAYDAGDHLLDRLIRGTYVDNGFALALPRRVQVWAAGNKGAATQAPSGFYSMQSAAKNTLTIGSSDALPAVAVNSADPAEPRVSKSSSLGPTPDGRLKPDLLAPGRLGSNFDGSTAGLELANHSGGYSAFAGTSFSAPAAAGIVALLMEAVDGAGQAHEALLPSTYKAVLVATATDLVKTKDWAVGEFVNVDTQQTLRYPVGPDFATGFGLIDALRAKELIEDTGRWAEADLLLDEEHSFCVSVPEGAEQLQVALAWDDPAAVPPTENYTDPLLVNDLDLELIDPNGGLHLPWAPEPPELKTSPFVADNGLANWDLSTTPRGVDQRNNVELATVENPAPGSWTVRVRASSPLPESQAFSLASSAPLAALCFTAQLPVCTEAPWICNKDRYIIPEFNKERLKWAWPADAWLDVHAVALARGVQPLVAATPWDGTGGYRLHATGAPADAVLLLFDDHGTVLARVESRGARETATLTPPPRTAGRRHFLTLLHIEGLSAPLQLELEYEQL